MRGAFAYTLAFNGDLSRWDVRKVETLEGAFYNTNAFNGNGLSRWHTFSLVNMYAAFENSLSFNGEITNWATSDAEARVSPEKAPWISVKNKRKNMTI